MLVLLYTRSGKVQAQLTAEGGVPAADIDSEHLLRLPTTASEGAAMSWVVQVGVVLAVLLVDWCDSAEAREVSA